MKRTDRSNLGSPLLGIADLEREGKEDAYAHDAVPNVLFLLAVLVDRLECMALAHDMIEEGVLGTEDKIGVGRRRGRGGSWRGRRRSNHRALVPGVLPGKRAGTGKELARHGRNKLDLALRGLVDGSDGAVLSVPVVAAARKHRHRGRGRGRGGGGGGSGGGHGSGSSGQRHEGLLEARVLEVLRTGAVDGGRALVVEFPVGHQHALRRAAGPKRHNHLRGIRPTNRHDCCCCFGGGCGGLFFFFLFLSGLVFGGWG